MLGCAKHRARMKCVTMPHTICQLRLLVHTRAAFWEFLPGTAASIFSLVSLAACLMLTQSVLKRVWQRLADLILAQDGVPKDHFVWVPFHIGDELGHDCFDRSRVKRCENSGRRCSSSEAGRCAR